MNALIPVDAALPGALTTAEIDATMALATRQAYASDWRGTSPPGAPPEGATALPAHQGLVAAYLSSLAQVQDTCKKWSQAAPGSKSKRRTKDDAQFICYSIEIIGPPSDHRPIHFRTPRAKRPLHWGSVPRDYQPPYEAPTVPGGAF